MKSSLIPDHEALFAKTLTDSSGKQFKITETTDLGDGIVLKKLKSSVHSGFYYAEKTQKSMIVLHSTIGVLKGDIATLTNASNPVSVSYVVARDGTVYELFDPSYWSYHLGKGTIGGNKINSSRSIGIEISNMGPLTLINGGLETVYSRKTVVSNGTTKTTAPDVYCTIDDTKDYKKIETPFRGYQYFAAYTDKQYIALNKLISKLCADYSIPHVTTQNKVTPFSEKDAVTFNGVCSHVNFRTEGKWDLGPDFDWSRAMATEQPKVTLSTPTGLPPFLPNATPAPVPTKPTFSSFLPSFLKTVLK